MAGTVGGGPGSGFQDGGRGERLRKQIGPPNTSRDVSLYMCPGPMQHAPVRFCLPVSLYFFILPSHLFPEFEGRLATPGILPEGLNRGHITRFLPLLEATHSHPSAVLTGIIAGVRLPLCTHIPQRYNKKSVPPNHWRVRLPYDLRKSNDVVIILVQGRWSHPSSATNVP